MNDTLPMPVRPNASPAIGETLPRHSLGDMQTMAEAVAASRLFSGVDTPQKALTLMLLCEAEQIHPMEAMRRYHIIEGKPSMRADAMQAEYQRKGGRIEWIETTTEACEARFSHPTHQPKPMTIRVTLADLMERGVAVQWDKESRELVPKPMYRRFPAQMLRARVVAEGVRMVLPGVVTGIYSPEEILDVEPLQIIDATPPPKPQPLPPLPMPPLRSPDPVKQTPEPLDNLNTFLTRVCRTANDDWDATCKIEKITDRKTFEKLIANAAQVRNVIVGEAVEEGLIAFEAVAKDDKPDVRDPKRVTEMANNLYTLHTDWTRLIVQSYLTDKREEAETALGLRKATAPWESSAPTPDPLTNAQARELFGPGADD